MRRVFEHEPLSAMSVTRVTLHDKRYYECPTGTYQSVTTIIGDHMGKEHLDAWRARVGEDKASKITTQAANRGTAVHELCENYLSNHEDFARRAMPSNILTFNSIRPILDQHIGKIYGIEHMMYSPTLKAAGTTDLIAEYDGVNSIIDFKTSLKPKREEWITNYFLQSTVYAMMVEEMYGISVPQFVIIIAVDHEEPQVFVKQKEQYVDTVKDIFIR